MIAIIDYGMGNLRSVQKAFETVGAKAAITQDAAVLKAARGIVLPGVGAMAPAVQRLVELNLVAPIEDAIQNKKPFLGICLGLQLLFDLSDEGGQVKGLGICPGKVTRFTQLKVPHMGWNQLKINQANSRLFKNLPQNNDVYFCHSYYVSPQMKDLIAATTDYGIPFTSAIEKDNLFGVQFHPEKSQRLGLQILKNFCTLTEI